MLLDYMIPMPREIWNAMTWRGSPPFAEWGDWSGLAAEHRVMFEHRDRLLSQREDFFIERWPKLFGACGLGWLQRRLDYALEVPGEVARGGATKFSVSYRRARRVINRRRFGVNRRRVGVNQDTKS